MTRSNAKKIDGDAMPHSNATTTPMAEAIEAGDAGRIRGLVADDPAVLRRTAVGGVPWPMVAVYHGRPEVADLLLELGARLDAHTAAALGRGEDLARMIDRRPAVLRDRSPDGWTPLHLAAYFGHAGTAAMLIDRGADLAARSKNATENTPLHAAAAGGRMETLRLLVERGTDVNADATGVAPLDIACGRRDDEMVRFLVDRGAEKSSKGGRA